MWRAVAVTAGAALLAAVGLLAVVGTPDARAQDAAVERGSAERGAVVYRVACITCHGPAGAGVDGWPDIRDAGAASADFQLRTGRMPFAGERGQQALPKPPAYDEQTIADLVAFVAILGDGPDIPEVEVEEELLQEGHQLFTSNCAPCHGASGNGGAVGGGAIAWPLTDVAPVTVAEAMITGPGQMPRFLLPDEEINAVVTYVEYLQEAPTPGGFAIGGIGPVPEGFVAWVVGTALLVATAFLVGREWSRKGDGTVDEGP